MGQPLLRKNLNLRAFFSFQMTVPPLFGTDANAGSPCILLHTPPSSIKGVGIAQWLQHQTRDQKGPGFKSRQERRENFLLQGQLSVLTLISVSVPPLLPQ